MPEPSINMLASDLIAVGAWRPFASRAGTLSDWAGHLRGRKPLTRDDRDTIAALLCQSAEALDHESRARGEEND